MTSSTTAATATGPATTRRVLQRQILPIDRDTDVYRLYVDPEAAVLDADKYEVGSNRSAQRAQRRPDAPVDLDRRLDPPRPDPRPRGAARAGRGAASRSAPTSTPSRPATGGATRSSPRSP